MTVKDKEELKTMVEEYMKTCKPKGVEGFVCYEEEYKKALEALIALIEGDLENEDD